MATLIAICLGGLEDQVISDIAKFAPTNAVIESFSKSKISMNSIEINGKWLNKGECGCGKIFIRNLDSVDFIHRIRSVQHWLVYMGASTTVPTTVLAGIEHIQNVAASNVNFDITLSTWKNCLTDVDRIKLVDIIDKKRAPKFCVRCIRDGTHEYNSVDVAKKLGESVLAKTDWTVDLRNMDLEIIVLLMSETMLIGINVPTLSPAFLKSHIPGEIRPPVVPSGLTSCLRPSTAYLLIQLAKPELGDVLVDGMCGCGAAFIEAAFGLQCVAIGGDVDIELQSTLKQSINLAGSMSANRAIAELAWWGAPRLPLVTGSVDILMLDLPFGKVSKKVPKHCRAKVPKHVTEIARVLRPGVGRCVLLVQSHQHLVACLDSAFFADITTIGVNIGGYICSIVTAKRSHVEYQAVFTLPISEQHIEADNIVTTVGNKRSVDELL